MLLFRRILDFPRTALARLRDKRRDKRWPVVAGFPLKASVSLKGGNHAARGTLWRGMVVDLSGEGIRLRFPAGAMAVRGETSVLGLELEQFELRIPCTVAHFRVSAASSLCGLSLQFQNDTQRRGYLQLLEGVVIGAGFAAGKAPKSSSGLVCLRYLSEGHKATLTAWREAIGGKLSGFELVVGGHCVRGDVARGELQVCASDAARTTLPAGTENREVIHLYRIIVANLAKAVAPDLRQKMQTLARPMPVLPPL